MGQRTTFAFLFTIVLLIAAVALGQQPGTFPALAAGDPVTPNALINLIGQIVAPLTLLLAMLSKLFTSINSRVAEGSLKPGEFLLLFKLPEFWTAIIGSIVGIGEMLGVHLLTPDQQIVVANGLLGLFTVLLDSLGKRASKSDEPTAMIVQGKAVAVANSSTSTPTSAIDKFAQNLKTRLGPTAPGVAGIIEEERQRVLKSL